MAVTGYWYHNGLKAMLNKEIDWDTDTIKVMLCTSTYTPSRTTHDYKNDITNEATGTGYTAGGATLGSCSNTYTVANSWGTAWAGTTGYSVGDIVRPASGNTHLYRCIVAGTSGSGTPTWPTTSGQIITDSTVTWAECGSGIVVLDAADTTWSSSTITARYAVIYLDTGSPTTSPLLGYQDFGSDQASDNGNFTIQWPAQGILQLGIA